MKIISIIPLKRGYSTIMDENGSMYRLSNKVISENDIDIGEIDREVEIIREVFVDILKPLRDGYTFKGSRAKVKIRSGVAGDIDDLVGRK